MTRNGSIQSDEDETGAGSKHGKQRTTCPECGGTNVRFSRDEWVDEWVCDDCQETVETWPLNDPRRTGEGDYRHHADRRRGL